MTAAGVAGRRLRANVRWNLLGNAAYALGQWLQLVIFARLGGPEAVGAWAFALALTAPIMMFGYLQLRTLLASDARGAHLPREYRRLRVITTTASLAAVAAAAAATDEGRRLWPILVPVGAMRAADALADLYYGLWQRDERMRPIGVGLALNATASVAFMLALAAAGGGAPGAAAGSALGSWVALAYVHLRTSADPELRAALAVRPPAGPGRLLRLAREAAPLGLIVLLGSLQANVPRYFLQRQAGAAALGLFAAASQLTSAGTIVIGALGAAATPRVARLFAAGDGPGLRAVTRGLVLAGAGLGVLGVLLAAAVGRPVLAVVFRPEFAAAAPTLVVLSAAAGLGFVATLLGYLLTAARSIAVQPVLLLATLAATSVGCALLVPARGAPGAAWALAAGAAVQLGWSAIAVARLRPGARADAAAPDLPLGRAESP